MQRSQTIIQDSMRVFNFIFNFILELLVAIFLFCLDCGQDNET